MKAHFRLFQSCDPDLIIKLISLRTFEVLITTSEGLTKKYYVYYTFTHNHSESSHLRACLVALKKILIDSKIPFFKSSSSVDMLPFKKSKS